MGNATLTLALVIKAQIKALKSREKYELETSRYIRDAAIEFAARFPRRRIEVASGMGTISVWVEKGPYFRDKRKKFDYYDELDLERKPFSHCHPQFLKVLENMDNEFGSTYANFPSCHDMYLEFEGGKLVRERKDW